MRVILGILCLVFNGGFSQYDDRSWTSYGKNYYKSYVDKKWNKENSFEDTFYGKNYASYKKRPKMYVPRYANFKIRQVNSYDKFDSFPDYTDFKPYSFITGNKLTTKTSLESVPQQVYPDASMKSRLYKDGQTSYFSNHVHDLTRLPVRHTLMTTSEPLTTSLIPTHWPKTWNASKPHVNPVKNQSPTRRDHSSWYSSSKSTNSPKEFEYFYKKAIKLPARDESKPTSKTSHKHDSYVKFEERRLPSALEDHDNGFKSFKVLGYKPLPTQPSEKFDQTSKNSIDSYAYGKDMPKSEASWHEPMTTTTIPIPYLRPYTHLPTPMKPKNAEQYTYQAPKPMVTYDSANYDSDPTSENDIGYRSVAENFDLGSNMDKPLVDPQNENDILQKAIAKSLKMSQTSKAQSGQLYDRMMVTSKNIVYDSTNRQKDTHLSSSKSYSTDFESYKIDQDAYNYSDDLSNYNLLKPPPPTTSTTRTNIAKPIYDPRNLDYANTKAPESVGEVSKPDIWLYGNDGSKDQSKEETADDVSIAYSIDSETSSWNDHIEDEIRTSKNYWSTTPTLTTEPITSSNIEAPTYLGTYGPPETVETTTSYTKEIPNYKPTLFLPNEQPTKDSSIWSISNLDFQKNMVSLAHEFLKVVRKVFGTDDISAEYPYSTTTESTVFGVGFPSLTEGNDMPKIEESTESHMSSLDDASSYGSPKQASFLGDSGIFASQNTDISKSVGYGVDPFSTFMSNFGSKSLDAKPEKYDTRFNHQSMLVSDSRPQHSGALSGLFSGGNSFSLTSNEDSGLTPDVQSSNLGSKTSVVDGFGMGSPKSTAFEEDSGLLKSEKPSSRYGSTAYGRDPMGVFGGGHGLTSSFEPRDDATSQISPFGIAQKSDKPTSGFFGRRGGISSSFGPIEEPSSQIGSFGIASKPEESTKSEFWPHSTNFRSYSISQTHENLWPTFHEPSEYATDDTNLISGNTIENSIDSSTVRRSMPKHDTKEEIPSIYDVFIPPPQKCKAVMKENCKSSCIDVTVSFCCCPLDQILY